MISGVVTAIGLGMSMDGRQQGVAMPNGIPCGLVDGVPQICWSPYGGGFEGSPDLPTGAKSFSAPQAPRPTPELQLEIQPLEPRAKEPAAGQ